MVGAFPRLGKGQVRKNLSRRFEVVLFEFDQRRNEDLGELGIGPCCDLEFVKDHKIRGVELPPIGVDAFFDPRVLGTLLDLGFFPGIRVQASLVEALHRGLDQIEAGRKMMQHGASRHAGCVRNVLRGGVGVTELVKTV